MAGENSLMRHNPKWGDNSHIVTSSGIKPGRRFCSGRDAMKTARLTSLPPSGGLQFFRLLKNVLVIGLFAASMQLHAAETAYRYDARGRLISVLQEGTRTTYVYDDAGNRLQVETVQETVTKCGQGFNRSVNHSSGPLNLRTLGNSLGYDGSTFPQLTVTITGNITGASEGNAIETGSWPTGSCIKVIINSGVTVRGGGGNGGNGGGGLRATPGQAGTQGGHAVWMQSNLTVVNNGALRGGSGGGGGGSGKKLYNSYGEWMYYGGGGGGGGWPNGKGGAGGTSMNGNGASGANGTSSGGGAGGAGAWSNPGSAGGGVNSVYGTGSKGGAPGNGIKKNGWALSYSGSGVNSSTGT